MPDRKPNRRSSIYQGQDGWWHGWVTVGIKDDGSPDRRHRMGRTEAEVTRKVQDLERNREIGHLVGTAKGLTVAQWMETWLTTIAPRRIRRSTLDSTYAPKVRNRIIPGLGKHRLDRLTAEHLERFYSRLEDDGLAPATVLQIHRILSRALKVAMQRGYVTRNVATLVDAPPVSQAEIEPLTLVEAQRITELAANRRNGTRWSVALALGLRQGEALGLRWQHVDLDAATLTVRWQLQRLAWRHGCADPHACGKHRHRPSCSPDCTGHARSCPKRTGGGLRFTELKSGKSVRTIALSPQLVAALRAHRAAQLEERLIAGPTWEDGDFVWCQPNGRPIGAHADWSEWKALLKAAGVRDARVHDARHTAATLLLAQGVDQRVVMEILGHSQISMTSKYAHVLPEVMTDAADRIGQALWGYPSGPTATRTATKRPDGSATQ
jgi:integrase